MKYSVSRCGKAQRTETKISIVATCFLVFVLVIAAMIAPGPASVHAANAGDPARGKDLFEKRCTGCHSLDSNKEGPRLRDVYGRKAGSIANFNYSDGLKGAQFTWDQGLLDRWLTDTESVVPDNDMTFHVPKADERADIIEFLRVSSGK
jgi:cytochrome c